MFQAIWLIFWVLGGFPFTLAALAWLLLAIVLDSRRD